MADTNRNDPVVPDAVPTPPKAEVSGSDAQAEAISEAAPAREHWRIRSFSLRGSRLGKRQAGVFAAHPELILPMDPGPVLTTVDPARAPNIAEHFGREAPLVVEIGPGSGEQGIAYAVRNPQVNVLMVEAWDPGAERCVAAAVRVGVKNVRILRADAAQALPVLFGLKSAGENDPARALACGAEIDPAHPGARNGRAAEIWTFFPDPWRKKKHHKRRLVAPLFAATAAGILEDGGVWRLATDWDNYAWQMRDVVEASPYFTNPHAGQNPDPQDPQPSRGGFAPRWEGRVLTRFEQRGKEAGRTVHDLAVLRQPRAGQAGTKAAVAPAARPAPDSETQTASAESMPVAEAES
ncbi:tRNA (guanine-N7-)-methyltransferase [Actinobaculum suis]|uniref:tRNA (guanine-N(7)-)-methyltransferase n=1 Tax=Actinobaculum suis TaxID=1657 RepID=A0A1G7EMY4_9ACTO|nr:tRNA (guanine-N7)-methyltransferase [Actinobaculum suis]MDY5153183.1 tRNA (guanine-N7)-methyltransferase [Actinobaculum suis]SDE65011.1 tRNA (guanine-N7-)-methyltransferase [Actinobaculum suis]